MEGDGLQPFSSAARSPIQRKKKEKRKRETLFFKDTQVALVFLFSFTLLDAIYPFFFSTFRCQ